VLLSSFSSAALCALSSIVSFTTSIDDFFHPPDEDVPDGSHI
jgi:hypothetical protein